MKPASLQQPDYFDAFHCINSACEDTCCVGWIVHIDKATYGRYQTCSSPELGHSLRTLITINEKSSNDEDFAQIVPHESGCTFLSHGLCAVQVQLGEQYLSNMCATYPRVMNRVDQVLQRSLDLSCPEAARVVLLNPRPMEFLERGFDDGSIRRSNYPAVDLSGLQGSAEPCQYFRDVKRLVIAVLQNRSHPVWKRLFILGCLCGRLDETGDLNGIQSYLDSLSAGILDDLMSNYPPQPGAQLEIVLELMVARISSEANPRRFLECYQEFIHGLQWTSKSTADELAASYGQAFSQHYMPLMNQHEHIFEHYLVNYAYRTLFPFGLPDSNLRLRNDRVGSPLAAQYMLLVAYYAIVKTLLIGMAGFHKSAFSVDHVIKLIQSCAKTFEHSLTYPGQVIEMLAGKSMTTAESLCVLIRN
jgi:lysine-N-methylase